MFAALHCFGFFVVFKGLFFVRSTSKCASFLLFNWPMFSAETIGDGDGDGEGERE